MAQLVLNREDPYIYIYIYIYITLVVPLVPLSGKTVLLSQMVLPPINIFPIVLKLLNIFLVNGTNLSLVVPLVPLTRIEH